MYFFFFFNYCSKHINLYLSQRSLFMQAKEDLKTFYYFYFLFNLFFNIFIYFLNYRSKQYSNNFLYFSYFSYRYVETFR